MKRAAGYTLAWCGATALAVGISWLGVRDVLRSTAMDETPRAPLVADAPSGSGEVGGTSRPLPPADASADASAGGDRESPAPVPSVRHARAPSPHPTPRVAAKAPTKPAPDESLHTFSLKGGRATIAVTAGDCRVVTATPNDGYELKVWETSSWLRVAFLQAPHESSAFCTWNALPPRLDTYEN
ncbi:hypothetical protein Pth03_48250 [Planotetraspora thailandica]|uniref:Secreted protein n=1 Tax=Planotetraspora thailandica TaxID=487172 RepID=A0A8J3XXV0_9ACTN|nr:hypothetical protein [Planotetraspora thailandica]GII56436.1 hypothetical protein Pth03_48250 [Planotetraspora thailandica]